MKKFLLVALAATLLAGCGTTRPQATVAPAGVAAAKATKSADRMPPMIQYVTANNQMGTSFVAPPNYHIQFNCWAVGDGFLTYDWRSWTPIFNYGQMATWTTPFQPGTYDIQVWVRDQMGQSDWRTVYVQVRPQATLAPTTLSDEDKATAKQPPAANGTSKKTAVPDPASSALKR